MTDENNARIEPVRHCYYDEVYECSLKFARELLTLTPELESIAIVPAYQQTLSDIPTTVLVGRNGPPATAVEVMHLSAQLHRAQVHLSNYAARFLQYVDRELATGIQRLHEVRGELGELSDKPNDAEQPPAS